MKRFLAVLLAAVFVAAALPFTAFAAEDGEVLVISENGDYTIDASQTAPVDISGVNGAVTLDNAVINAAGRSAIVVKDGANVTFRLVGTSVIKGDANAYSCGIQVEHGSSVTFEGEGTLNVTGGRWGAAIGSYGTDINIPEEQRVQVGEITINSGNINAYAGARGAGIGSGYHVNGNKITINGGTIHAYGNELGAGIGSGYGTSGGAIGVAAVGEYDAGTIIINGGEVYAASAWDQSYDTSDLTELRNSSTMGNWGAGIGGGYGASASHIEINGGKVVATSASGGAAIGTGRGTSKKDHYNPSAYVCNIKIGGNADVTAITADLKDGDNFGGAAIGTGRGCHTGGNIEITGSAKVVAINASLSPAIGSTKKVSPVDGAIPAAETLTIGDGVTLYAVSAGDYAVDKDAASLSINDAYFGSSDRWFFGEDKVAIADVASVKAESQKGELVYNNLPQGSVSLWANIKSDAPAPTPTPEPIAPKGNLKIVAPLAMALRFEDGSVYYSGDSVEVELNKEYKFQMCTVDWTTRDLNGEKKIHKPYETFYPENSAWIHTNHGIYSDDNVGFRGSVVYRFTLLPQSGKNSFDEETKTFTLYKGNYTLRTDNNKCFMAYRFYYDENYDGNAIESMEGRVTTGIDHVLYDTGSDHVNTKEDFRYTKPLASLSINLPLGATVTAKEYIDDEFVKEAQILITIDEEHPDLCYKNFYWRYA